MSNNGDANTMGSTQGGDLNINDSNFDHICIDSRSCQICNPHICNNEHYQMCSPQSEPEGEDGETLAHKIACEIGGQYATPPQRMGSETPQKPTKSSQTELEETLLRGQSPEENQSYTRPQMHNQRQFRYQETQTNDQGQDKIPTGMQSDQNRYHESRQTENDSNTQLRQPQTNGQPHNQLNGIGQQNYHALNSQSQQSHRPYNSCQQNRGVQIPPIAQNINIPPKIQYVMQNIDTSPGNFTGTSENSFYEYFIEFENYVSNSGMPKTRWSQYLLEKIPKEIYDTLPSEVKGMDIYKIADFITSHLRLVGEEDKANPEAKFFSIKKLPSENVKTFASRLMQAYLIAYPERDCDKDSLLNQKFLEGIPSEIKRQVKLGNKFRSNRMTYKEITGAAIHIENDIAERQKYFENRMKGRKNPQTNKIAKNVKDANLNERNLSEVENNFDQSLYFYSDESLSNSYENIPLTSENKSEKKYSKSDEKQIKMNAQMSENKDNKTENGLQPKINKIKYDQESPQKEQRNRLPLNCDPCQAHNKNNQKPNTIKNPQVPVPSYNAVNYNYPPPNFKPQPNQSSILKLSAYNSLPDYHPHYPNNPYNNFSPIFPCWNYNQLAQFSNYPKTNFGLAIPQNYENQWQNEPYTHGNSMSNMNLPKTYADSVRYMPPSIISKANITVPATNATPRRNHLAQDCKDNYNQASSLHQSDHFVHATPIFSKHNIIKLPNNRIIKVLYNKKHKSYYVKANYEYVVGPKALNIDINKIINERINKLPKELRNKVVAIYNDKSKKSMHNFIQCPHISKTKNVDCNYCKFADPDVLRLERIIKSFQPIDINNHHNPSSLNINNKHIESKVNKNENRMVKQNQNKINKNGSNDNKGMKSNNKVNKNKFIFDSIKFAEKNNNKCNQNQFVKANIKSNNYQNKFINNPNKTAKSNKNKSVKNAIIKESSIPVYDINGMAKQLNELCNPNWVSKLEKANEKSVQCKEMSFYNGEKLIATFNVVSEPWKPNSLVMVNTLERTNKNTFLMENKEKIIELNKFGWSISDDMDQGQSLYYVNLNNHTVRALIDSGSQESFLREDFVQKLGLRVEPIPKNEANATETLTNIVKFKGIVKANVKFLDVDVGEYSFKVVPFISELNDEMVLGQNFLFDKKLTIYGDKKLIKGYLPNINKSWVYHSSPHMIRRILCYIDCKSKLDVNIKTFETVAVPVEIDMPPEFKSDKIECNIPNFAHAFQTNLVRQKGNRKIDKSKKWDDFDYYIVDFNEPYVQICNPLSVDLKCQNEEKIGELFSISTIYLNVDIPKDLEINEYNSTKYYDVLREHYNEKISGMDPEIRSQIIKQNFNEKNKFDSRVTQSENLNLENEENFMSPFNPPDYDLPEIEEWTPQSLRDSINIGCYGKGEHVKKLYDIVWEYREVVSNLKYPKASILPPVKFETTSNEIIYTPQYKLPQIATDELTKIIENMLENNIIEESTSPHSSALQVTFKKGGDPRVCIDLRSINRILLAPAPPLLPRPEELMSQLHGMKVFSSFDLLGSYNQISLDPISRPLTAFRFNYSSYQYTRLPFGAKPSGIYFTMLLNIVLKDLLKPIQLTGDEKPRLHMTLYVDDICLYCLDEIQHLELIELLFAKLKEHQLRLKLKKCFFMCDTFSFLGMKWTQNSVTKEEAYVNKIMELPRPITRRDVASFLGAIVYISRFVENFASIARPLSSETTSNKRLLKEKIIWNDEMETAFTKLKELVRDDVNLTYPDFSEGASPLEVHTDASTHGSGAFLAQKQNGEHRIIAFHSSTFSKTEKNYSVTELELLSVKIAFRAFSIFIKARHFKLYTDHSPISHLVALKPFNSRIVRTIEALSDFDFEVIWKPGKSMVLADYLSRLPCVGSESVNRFDPNDNFTKTPDGFKVYENPEGGGNSMLEALQISGQLNGIISLIGVDQLRELLHTEISNNMGTYGLHIDSSNRQHWLAIKNPGLMPPICFVQAYANVKKVNVHMYFGSENPIIFQSNKSTDKNIYIQNVGNVHYKSLIPLGNLEIKLQNSYPYSLANVDTFEEYFKDIYQIDDIELENINLEVNENIKSTINKLTSPIVDVEQYQHESNKLPPEEVLKKPVLYCDEDGYSMVNPGSYGSIYEKRCKHFITTASFVPVKINEHRLCGIVDTGSSCNVLSMSIAENLFKQGKIKYLDKQIMKVFTAAGGCQSFNTRTVIVDIQIGVAKFKNVHMILLPDNILSSCVIIGNSLLNTKGIQLDFERKVIIYKKHVIVELARMMHGVFYAQDKCPKYQGEIPVTPPIKIFAEAVDKKLKEIRKKQLSKGVPEKSATVEIKNNTKVKKIKETKLGHYINEYNLEIMQKKNNYLRQLKNILVNNVAKLPPHLKFFSRARSHLKMINNVIYYLRESYAPVPVLPIHCIITMALKIHNEYLHCGREKLLDLMKNVAYHTNMDIVLGQLTASCPVCLLRKQHSPKFKPPIIRMKTSHPFEMVVVDLVQMPKWGKYNYLLTLVDHKSKWARACPLKSKTSQEVADAFENKILPYLLLNPKYALFDRGLEFVAFNFKQMLERNNIKPLYSTSFYPQSHGAVEIFNKSIIQLLRIEAQEANSWPLSLDKALKVYNTTKHSAINMSPCDFLLKKEHKFNKVPQMDPTETQYWRVGHPGFKSYKKGEFVMKVIPKIGNRTSYKLKNLYSGPYKIIEVFKGGVSYKLMEESSGKIIVSAHHSQLRNWVQPTKVLMNNFEFKKFYEFTKPLSMEEEEQQEQGEDPAFDRTFHSNWRPEEEIIEDEVNFAPIFFGADNEYIDDIDDDGSRYLFDEEYDLLEVLDHESVIEKVEEREVRKPVESFPSHQIVTVIGYPDPQNEMNNLPLPFKPLTQSTPRNNRNRNVDSGSASTGAIPKSYSPPFVRQTPKKSENIIPFIVTPSQDLENVEYNFPLVKTPCQNLNRTENVLPLINTPMQNLNNIEIIPVPPPYSPPLEPAVLEIQPVIAEDEVREITCVPLSPNNSILGTGNVADHINLEINDRDISYSPLIGGSKNEMQSNTVVPSNLNLSPIINDNMLNQPAPLINPGNNITETPVPTGRMSTRLRDNPSRRRNYAEMVNKKF